MKIGYTYGEVEPEKILFEVDGEVKGGGFEMNVVDSYSRAQGRHWFIRFFY